MKPQLNSLSIEITNLCNFKCTMCLFHSKEMNFHTKLSDHPSFINKDLFKRIVDEYAEFDQLNKHILPQFQGEPLMNPDFLELLEYINSKKITFGFTTNSSLLTKEVTDKLNTFEYFKNIAFSIDSINKETFEKIRVNANYDKLLSNIEYFLSVCRDDIFISVNAVIQDSNKHEITDLVKFWLEKDKIKRVTAPFVTDDCCIPTQTNFEPGERHACPIPSGNMIILTNGQVIPCCKDVKYEFNLGNINSQSLEEIWNGKEFSDLRTLQEDGKWDDHSVCKSCLTWARSSTPTFIPENPNDFPFQIPEYDSYVGLFFFYWVKKSI